MRVLFARVGIPYSPFTGKAIRSQSISEMVDKINKLPKNNTIFILAPIVRGRKGEYKKEILNYKKRGFSRIKVDGKYLNIDEFPNLNKKIKHDISIIVDRIILNSKLGNRLADSVETACKFIWWILVVEYENETLLKNSKRETITFSSKNFLVQKVVLQLKKLAKIIFINSPYGACEECEGIGHSLNVDPNLVISDEKFARWCNWTLNKINSLYYAQTLASIAKHYKISLSEQWRKIPKKIQDIICMVSDEEEIKFSYDDGYDSIHQKSFERYKLMERRYLETDKSEREEISQYQVKLVRKM